MNLSGILSMTKKELRSAFLSPVALIFIGIFLLITLFSFFTQSRFFIRGIADVRPLFEWMPLLLIFLVSAMSMRAWSEESRAGTLELLLTLPIRSSELVLGKFFAGLSLVAVSLALTLPLPWSVAQLGPLDFGPVWGGYIASLLLASAYLAIGLFVSAMTENQIVSLMLSLLLCGLFYFVGSETLLAFVSQNTGELLAALGTGTRFESIERGVLDLRDLFYLLSITGFFLYLNTIAIERKRIERKPSDRSSRWGLALTTGGLLATNLLLANIHLSSLRSARLDLTEDQLYSVSEVTEDIIFNLSEEMSIIGYFSERTHPLLAPLVPQIKDLLEEYALKGKQQLNIEFIDPHTDAELEEEIGSQYGIRAIPISVADRSEMAFVNAYFHILMRYGDEHKVLSFEDLVDIKRDHSSGSVELKLKGLEYALTKAIKSVSQEFLSLDALMATQNIKLSAFVTDQRQLPEGLSELPARLSSIFQQMKSRAEQSGGQLSYEFIDPAKLSESERKRLAEEKGFVPIQLIDGGAYWLYGLIEVGKKSESILFLQKDLGQDNLSRLIEASIKRSAPGFRKTIGLFTKSESVDHPSMPYGQAPPPPKTDYRQLEEILSVQFDVQRLRLKDQLIPSDIDVLLLGKVGELSANQRFAIDQYLMGGGSIIALAGETEVEPEFMGQSQQIPPTFKAKELGKDLSEVLAKYGVKVKAGLVADQRALDIVYPVKQSFNRVQINQTAYPYFVQSTQEQFTNEQHAALSGLNSVTMLWASPLGIDSDLTKNLNTEVLIKSSSKSWISTDRSLSPDIKVNENEWSPQALALTVEGSFGSAFKASSSNEQSALIDKKSKETDSGDSKKDDTASLYQELSSTGRVLDYSVSGAKIAVLGSSEMVSDLGLGVGNYYSGLFGLRGDYNSGVLMIQNLIDWALADDSLASIRTAGPSSRILRAMSKEEEANLEKNNYIIALFALLLIALISILPRRLSQS